MNPSDATLIDGRATAASEALRALRGHVPSAGDRPAVTALIAAIDDLPPVCEARGYLAGVADAPHITGRDTR